MKIVFVDDPQQPGEACWLSSGGPGITNSVTGEPVPLREYAALSYRCLHCNDDRAVMIRHPDVERPSWEWDGNKEAPTLTPSIQHRGGCQWHGFLTAGEWVDA